MKISVEHIQEKPVVLHSEEPAEAYAVLERMQSQGECRFTGPIATEVSVAREYDHLRVTGRVSVPVALSCSRCLEDYRTTIEPSFTIIFRKGSEQEPAAEDETELSEQDLVSATYSGDEIDLAHEIEEQIIMELPLKPLCNEVCRGLCPSCGIDLNKSTCSCTREPINLKFAALKDFKVSK